MGADRAVAADATDDVGMRWIEFRWVQPTRQFVSCRANGPKPQVELYSDSVGGVVAGRGFSPARCRRADH